MKRKVFLIMMVTVAMAASIYTGCGNKDNAVEDTSYSADVHTDKGNADIPTTEKTAMEQQDQEQKKPENKIEIKSSAADSAPATEAKQSTTKTDTPKTDTTKTDTPETETKADAEPSKAASPKVDDTAAAQPQDTPSEETQKAQGNGSVNYFIGTHAGDPSQKITSVSRPNGTSGAKDNSQKAPAATSQETSGRQPQMTADHEHVWKEVMHTRYEWVPDIVTVDDYEVETKTVSYAHCNCGAVLTEAEYPAHYQAHEDKGECSDSHWEAEEVEVSRTKVGSHEEDNGHQEPVTYVDHVECEICKIDQKVWNP